jgi:sucrose-6-phosphate hydrolase SacC (GH32 family)
MGQTVINLPNAGECPDIFELPVDGDKDNKKWVFWGGNGNYYIGSFDRYRFQPESDVLGADLGANFYAAQTWSDIPESDGRRIQIAWMAGGKYPDMPFNVNVKLKMEYYGGKKSVKVAEKNPCLNPAVRSPFSLL